MTSVDPEGGTLTAISAHSLTLIVVLSLRIDVLNYTTWHFQFTNGLFSFQGSLQQACTREKWEKGIF